MSSVWIALVWLPSFLMMRQRVCALCACEAPWHAVGCPMVGHGHIAVDTAHWLPNMPRGSEDQLRGGDRVINADAVTG